MVSHILFLDRIFLVHIGVAAERHARTPSPAVAVHPPARVGAGARTSAAAMFVTVATTPILVVAMEEAVRKRFMTAATA